MREPIRVRFWGTRGSIPSPGPRTQRFGGNTPCVEVRVGDALLICDAGTGIRDLGTTLMKESGGRPVNGDIFVTHTHWDHIQGFPFFMPAYQPGNRFRIHSAHGVARSFEKIFRGLMDPAYFPVALGDMAAKLDFIEVSGPLQYGGVKVESTFSNHPGVNLAYRFEAGGRSVVYLTDHETYQTMHQVTEFAQKQDRLIMDFCRGADLLICDAQYTDDDYRIKKGWGHSRYRDTVALGLAAEVRRLALFHHDPWHDDGVLDKIEGESQSLASKDGAKMECFAAREGQTIEIS
ncbi:MAG: MBL fold metallo-hydrolase [Elusimicrobia bacterium]|nr:MBL fold metallo-hydrolase [Elusimicrobiota bacterium]